MLGMYTVNRRKHNIEDSQCVCVRDRPGGN